MLKREPDATSAGGTDAVRKRLGYAQGIIESEEGPQSTLFLVFIGHYVRDDNSV